MHATKLSTSFNLSQPVNLELLGQHQCGHLPDGTPAIPLKEGDLAQNNALYASNFPVWLPSAHKSFILYSYSELLSARWDAAQFMNHGINPKRSLKCSQLNFVF